MYAALMFLTYESYLKTGYQGSYLNFIMNINYLM